MLNRVRREAALTALVLAVLLLAVVLALAFCGGRTRPEVTPRQHPTPIGAASPNAVVSPTPDVTPSARPTSAAGAGAGKG